MYKVGGEIRRLLASIETPVSLTFIYFIEPMNSFWQLTQLWTYAHENNNYRSIRAVSCDTLLLPFTPGTSMHTGGTSSAALSEFTALFSL